MSATAATTTTEPAERATPSMWPVLPLMVAMSAYGAWALFQQNRDFLFGLGGVGLAIVVEWTVYGAIAVAVVWALQRFARRPQWSMVLALAWGGFAVTWLATDANAALSTIFLSSTGSDPAAWLSTPLVEEIGKALGVVGLLLIPAVRRMRALDGLFYGVLVGVGFQVVEDGIYTFITIFQGGAEPMEAIVGTMVVRGLTVGLFSHAVFTGLIGAALGWAASAPPGRVTGRVLGAAATVVAVMGLHGVFNFQESPDLVTLVLTIASVSALLLALRAARRDEQRCLALAADEAQGWGLLDSTQVALLDQPRPKAKDERRRQTAALAVAWAADHRGLDTAEAKYDAVRPRLRPEDANQTSPR